MQGHNNVSVLDGGLWQWIKDGYEVATGEFDEEIKAGDFEANKKNSLHVIFHEMMEIVKSQSCQIVDTRAAEHFHGKTPEPTTSMFLP